MAAPDLDGYPILRIDQLSLIEISTLEKSIPDAKALIVNLREESLACGGGKSQKSMIKYLQKQIDQTEKEIATRSAKDRVNALLSGTKELLVQAIPPSTSTSNKEKDKGKHEERIAAFLSEPKPMSSNHPDGSKNTSMMSVPNIEQTQSHTLTQHNPPPVAFYQPIPLPSQLAAAANGNGNFNKPKLSRAQAKEEEGEGGEVLHVSRSAGSYIERGGEVLTSRSSGGLTHHSSSSSLGELASTSANSSGASSNNNNHDHFSRNGSDVVAKPKRRPRSGNAVSSSDNNKPKSIYSQANLTGTTEKQNQMAIQQNFGNAFMVGATEKKKRFYPKKVVLETEAERREKLREKGRNQAMMRLLERKNKQIERNEEMKLRRMEEKSAAAKKKKEDLEKRHKRLEQQRVYQQQQQKKKEQEQEQLKEQELKAPKKNIVASTSSTNLQTSEDTIAVSPSNSTHCLDKDIEEPEVNPTDSVSVSGSLSSEDDASLSGGDDDPALAVFIPQAELDEVVQESAAVFDSYRLRNLAMRIASDSDTDNDKNIDNTKGDDEVTGDVSGGERQEKGNGKEHEKYGVRAEGVSNSIVVEKNKAALSTLRKLKLKKHTPTTESGGSQLFDNVQCADGVTDTMFVEEDSAHISGEEIERRREKSRDKKSSRQRRKKSRSRDGEDVGGGLRGVDDESNDDSEKGRGEDATEVKKKSKKSKKPKTKKSFVAMLNEDGEEVEVELEEEIPVKKKKKKYKKVKRVVTNEDGENVEVIEKVEVSDYKKKRFKTVTRTMVNEAGQEVEVIEEVEVRKRKKKGRDSSNDEVDDDERVREHDQGKNQQDVENEGFPSEQTILSNNNTITNSTSTSTSQLDHNSKKTTYDSSYTTLNQLFCSFFVPNSVFSTLVETVTEYREECPGDEPTQRTVHLSGVGPDSLPGLSAWVLASITAEGKAEWSVDATKLKDKDKEEKEKEDAASQSPRYSSLLLQRQAARQEVSYGIVLLARVCEPLLSGQGFSQAHSTNIETRFRSAWQNRVAQFDSIIADLSVSLQDMLFQRIFVCGNMAAVVSKLENLVTTAFRHPSRSGYAEAQRDHEAKQIQELAIAKGTVLEDKFLSKVEEEQEGRLGDDFYPSGSDTDSLDSSEYDDDSDDDDYLDHFHGAIDMLQSEAVQGRGSGKSLEEVGEEVNEEALLKTLLGEVEKDITDSGDDSRSGSDSKSSGGSPVAAAVTKQQVASSTATNVKHEIKQSRASLRSKPLPASSDRKPRSGNTQSASDLEVTEAATGKAKRDRGHDKDKDDKAIPSNTTSNASKSKTDPALVSRKGIPRDRSSSQSTSTTETSTMKKLHTSDTDANAISNTDINVDANDDTIKLTDVYSSIAEIFPAVRAKMDAMQAGCRPGDHAILAKILLESMHIQLKVYDDWLEVMDDYATVFCSDKEKGVQMRIEEGGDRNAAVYSGGSAALHYRVKSSRPEVNNIIKDVFGNVLKGWEELPTGLGLGVSWNILWSWTKPKIKLTQLLIWQRVNHFQNSKELTRKDTLKKNLHKYTCAIGNKAAEQFEIMPQTFLLPAEYTLFVKEYSAQEQLKAAYNASGGTLPPVRNMWIVKPVGLSRGRGISMLEDLSTLTYSQSTVLQKYIDNPLCLDGYKFDLRIYVVVTSFQPLEAFIYKDGFARISTVKYSTDAKSLSNLYIHLTNSSIQKHSESGPSKDNPLHISQGNKDESNGSKIGLLGKSGLWKRLEKYNIDIEQLWDAMCLLIVKSLVVVDDKIANQPCNFELFGYDVLFDQNLRPWLIEVNSGPSLARETQLDVRVKNALITDIIKLIDPPPFDRTALTKVLRQRIHDLQHKKFSMTSGDPELEKDLKAILGNHVPRRYGEIPRECGNFERLCPGTKNYNISMKLKSKLVKTPATSNGNAALKKR